MLQWFNDENGFQEGWLLLGGSESEGGSSRTVTVRAPSPQLIGLTTSWSW